MNTLIRIEEPGRRPQATPPTGFALWQLGFRPFYLLASLFAALSVPLWALQYAGWLGTPYLQGPLWHAHEMLFGFTLAVIVGFLFTAGRNWTGFANSEEAFADEFVGQRIQPFWIEDEAAELADTNFIVQGRFRPHAVRDGNLVTGQQQYSGTAAARLVIEALGR